MVGNVRHRLYNCTVVYLYVYFIFAIGNSIRFIEAGKLRAQQKLPTKAPAWYKNFPPWWMNPSALKAEASNYVNTMETPVPIASKPNNSSNPFSSAEPLNNFTTSPTS